MKKLILSFLALLGACYIPYIEGMQGNNPLKEPKRGYYPVNVSMKGTKTSPIHAALMDRELLHSIGTRTSKDCFRKLGNALREIRCFSLLNDTGLKSEIEQLQNLVHTIVTDEFILDAFTKEAIFGQFIKDLKAFMSDCISVITTKSPNKTKPQVLKRACQALKEQALESLMNYSNALVTNIAQLYDDYCASHKDIRRHEDEYNDAKRSHNAAKIAQNNAMQSLNQAQNGRNTAQKHVDSLSSSVQKLNTEFTRCHNDYDAYRTSLPSPSSRSREEELNEHLKYHYTINTRNRCKDTGAKLEKAQRLLTEREHILNCAQQSRSKALENKISAAERECLARRACNSKELLLEALSNFDQKTVGLLNNRACLPCSSLGRLDQELVHKIFTTFDGKVNGSSMRDLYDKAYDLFKDTPFFDEFILTLQRYVCLAYSQSHDIRQCAKGFRWEIEVGIFFYESLRWSNCVGHTFKTLSTHIEDANTKRVSEFDVTTSQILVECKNIRWSTCSYDRLTKILSQFCVQKSIAEQCNKKYLVVSQEAIPKSLRRELENNKIDFIDPVEAQEGITAATTFLKGGFSGLYNKKN